MGMTEMKKDQKGIEIAVYIADLRTWRANPQSVTGDVASGKNYYLFLLSFCC
jgi:hypothetical protein